LGEAAGRGRVSRSVLVTHALGSQNRCGMNTVTALSPNGRST
jgi:hypothetical protein